MAATKSTAMNTFEPTGGPADHLIGDCNPRGIPSVVFIEEIPSFIERLGTDGKIEPIIGAMNELYSKFKFMEMHSMKTKANLKSKIPEIRKTLDTIQFLVDKETTDEPVVTTFPLADNVFAKAEVGNSNVVCLWLGANVMLEYTYDEALQLCKGNLASAITKQEAVQEDLEFLRDQIITTEVNIARIFNYDVRVRRLKAQEEGEEESK